MVTHHSHANEGFKAAVIADVLTVSPALSSKQDAMMKKLSAKHGTEFDTAYSKDMVKDQKVTVKLFETEAKSGTSPEVKEFANETLPTLRDHLKNARAVWGSGDSSKM